jgi:hypothetical protein
VGDTVLLLKPKVIVRKHFGEKEEEYNMDYAESETASLELANSIKSIAKQKVNVIDVENDEYRLEDFYASIKLLLDGAKRSDTVNLAFNFSSAINVVSKGTPLKYPV